jgi:hypothetical protein
MARTTSLFIPGLLFRCAQFVTRHAYGFFCADQAFQKACLTQKYALAARHRKENRPLPLKRGVSLEPSKSPAIYQR